LKRCFRCNPDGAGYGWYDKRKKRWCVSKGHMKFRDFWKSFNKHRFSKNRNVVMHFRIGTSGKKQHPDCTHPFPVADNFEDMIATNFEKESIVVHNGVCGRGLGDASDTMVAIRDYIDPLLNIVEDVRVEKIMKDLIDADLCRWLITKGPEVKRLGGWIEDGGVYYSNSGYKQPVSVQSSRHSTGFNNYHRNSTAYDWMPKSCAVIYTVYSFKDYLINGNWSWTKYEEYLANRARQLEYIKQNPMADPEKAVTLVTIETTDPGGCNQSDAFDDGIYEIFDDDINTLAVVDDNGDILWDDVEDETVNHPCPNCEDEVNIVKSPFSVGDSMCCRCGAVFVHGLKGTEAVKMYDINTRRDFNNTQAVIKGENE
jgi:hypothetical protein